MAREGRAMVYSLTEAAQEFLSENRPTKSTLFFGSHEIPVEIDLTHSPRAAPLEARIIAHKSMYRSGFEYMFTILYPKFSADRDSMHSL